MTTQHNKTAGSAMATGLIMGGLGLIAGLLIAPKSGRETRVQLAEKRKVMMGRAKNAANEFKNSAKNTAEDVGQKAKTVATNVKSVARDRKEDAENIADQAQKTANEAENSLKRSSRQDRS